MSQTNIFGESLYNSKNNIQPGKNSFRNAELYYVPNLFSKVESDRYFNTFRNTIEWKQESMLIYGKPVNFPRLTSWYGDLDKPYSFSGITLHPQQWTAELQEIRTVLKDVTNLIFNSVLLNLYRNGNDSISWHSDGEKELGINPVIASVNFGQPRVFELKHNGTNEKLEISLPHGSLLLMSGETQHHWKHRVAKSNKITRERINLTFRILT